MLISRHFSINHGRRHQQQRPSTGRCRHRDHLRVALKHGSHRRKRILTARSGAALPTGGFRRHGAGGGRSKCKRRAVNVTVEPEGGTYITSVPVRRDNQSAKGKHNTTASARALRHSGERTPQADRDDRGGSSREPARSLLFLRRFHHRLQQRRGQPP